MKAAEREQLAKVQKRLASGELADQKCWSFIKEMNSYSAERVDSVAVRDGYRTYTYRQMFRYWEKYAEAFSAVNITEKNHSRVGLIGVQQTETIFAFYALNMTGASVSLIYHLDLYDEKRIRTMIEREKITDLVISEVYAFPKVMKGLLRDRDLLGLRNIIVLESPMGGEYAIPPLEMVRKLNTSMFRELDGGLVMEDLMKEYEATPIAYGSEKSSDGSIILHTTGTVSGIHKPVPMSDKALNSFVITAVEAKDTYEDFKHVPDHLVSFLALPLSWVYAMVDMLHTAFGLGMEVVCLPFGATNPRYADAIENYGISILFTSMGILDTWNKMMPDVDLSKVKVVFMGGTYVSPEFKKSFNEYLRSHGSGARIINGYGMSELGGACIIAPSDRDDDAIGFPLPGFKVKIFSEDEKKFYNISDGPRTGVLYLSSPTMSSGRLDDTVFFKLEKIGGDEYFNSNDLVRVNEDGSLTCIGRSNQFFVNNAGIRFDAGLIENAITAQPGIAACGIVPEFHKMIHDNVPILYVETTGGSDGLGVVRDALIQVFIKDGKLADTNLPSQVVLTEKIPKNAGGKVDTKRLASGGVDGKRYNVSGVKLNDKIVDILVLPAPKGEAATVGGGVPDELENDPYNILSEIFAAIPEIKEGGLTRIMNIPGLRDLVMKLTDFDVSNIPGSIGKFVPKLMKMSVDELPPMPKMKGDSKKGDIKNRMKNFLSMFEAMEASEFPMPVPIIPPVPLMPPLPLMPWGMSGKKNSKKKEPKDQWDHLKDGVETQREQMRNVQKVSLDACREQWDKSFPRYMEMMETIAATLPDEAPFLPGMPSPRAFMERMNEFQKAANENARKQADAFCEFFMEGQQQARSVITDTVENIENAVKKTSDDAAEKAGQD